MKRSTIVAERGAVFRFCADECDAASIVDSTHSARDMLQAMARRFRLIADTGGVTCANSITEHLIIDEIMRQFVRRWDVEDIESGRL